MEGALIDGAANQEINSFASKMGVPAGMDGVIDKEADQFIGGPASTGGTTGMAQTGGDGMINQEVNNVASEMGVPGVADGMIDKVVDQEANKFI